jgi:hypothetical protein
MYRTYYVLYDYQEVTSSLGTPFWLAKQSAEVKQVRRRTSIPIYGAWPRTNRPEGAQEVSERLHAHNLCLGASHLNCLRCLLTKKGFPERYDSALRSL